MKLSSVIINASKKTQRSLVKDMDDGKTISFIPFVSKRQGPYKVAVSEVNTEIKVLNRIFVSEYFILKPQRLKEECFKVIFI